MTCSAAAFCCSLRNSQNEMSAYLVILPVSSHCLTLLADWKLFVPGEAVFPWHPLAVQCWTSSFLVLPHHQVFTCAKLPLFLNNLWLHWKAQFPRTTFIWMLVFVLLLYFLLWPLKILFYKGSPLFLNTGLCLLWVFGRDLVQLVFGNPRKLLQVYCPCSDSGSVVCWDITPLFSGNTLPQAVTLVCLLLAFFAAVSTDSSSPEVKFIG